MRVLLFTLALLATSSNGEDVKDDVKAAADAIKNGVDNTKDLRLDSLPFRFFTDCADSLEISNQDPS